MNDDNVTQAGRFPVAATERYMRGLIMTMTMLLPKPSEGQFKNNNILLLTFKSDQCDIQGTALGETSTTTLYDFRILKPSEDPLNLQQELCSPGSTEKCSLEYHLFHHMTMYELNDDDDDNDNDHVEVHG
ncbi:hypothetical protein DPMN_098420 [Dreissena polymorpha]|uniref:Uncharacterized protein n=1 Tax=Dreissena polymorpha TaxID=45954 RepID=A0A9D4LD00_DREPO|nr:hypothetical protein DPMN_098420 [Dreissena polymorpha]